MKLKNKLFWILPLGLFAFQFIYTQNSLTQIRYEELAESVRNVFWLQYKTIYDGISSNIGWYGTLLFIYNIFGFDINSAKYFRLFLHLISLLCLASILRKYLGEKIAIIPLITIGLSPTFLFFNTLQTSYGIDIQYLFIILYFLASLNFKKIWFSVISQIMLWEIIMIAWMSYPTFIFYIPSLGIFYFWNLWKNFRNQKKIFILNSTISLSAFFTPLLIGILFVKDKQLLLYDSVTKGGVFRGAGTLQFNLTIFWTNLTALYGDLFVKANSYYFDISTTDFSNLYPLISILMILIIIIKLSIKYEKYRFPVLLISLVLVLDLTISNLTIDPSGLPGIRRHTAFLISIYGFYTIVWYFLNKFKFNQDQQGIRNILIVILLVVPLHNFFAYFDNLLNLSKPSIFQYPQVFNIASTPKDSLDLFVQHVQSHDLKLGCKNDNDQDATCRYSEIYPAVAGSCLWNNIKCKNIFGFDEKKKEYIPLSINLWEKYYWSH